jgi:glutathionylspermidine synthase
VLWRLFEGHPNLLPAFFADEIAAGGARVERAREQLERGSVTKPIFSREGASIRIQEAGRETEASANRAYDARPMIVQAYAPLPVFDGQRPVVGAWIVGRDCVGMGLREDTSRITQLDFVQNQRQVQIQKTASLAMNSSASSSGMTMPPISSTSSHLRRCDQ